MIAFFLALLLHCGRGHHAHRPPAGGVIVSCRTVPGTYSHPAGCSIWGAAR